jgi:hypothetical protein
MDRQLGLDSLTTGDGSGELPHLERVARIRETLKLRDAKQEELLRLISLPDKPGGPLTEALFQLKRAQADVDRLLATEIREHH